MTSDLLISQAEEIAEIAKSENFPLIVIGAVALAGHGYIRMTRDIDLAGNLSIEQFNCLTQRLEGTEHQCQLHLPNADDPLGGVLDISGSYGLIQVISFHERFPALLESAIQDSKLPLRENSSLQLIPLEHLVVLKLYAGGLKSKADIIELLHCNPKADLNRISSMCTQYGQPGFSEILQEL